MTHEGVDGVHFAVWAPQAQRVSVVGDFNHWDGRRHPMRKRVDSGLWEIFAPGLGDGTFYKYEILGATGHILPLKADPFGQQQQLRPSTASVVASDHRLRLERRRLAGAARANRRAPRADVDLRGPSRLLASAHDPTKPMAASSPTTNSPTASSPMRGRWASPISNCCRSPSIRSTPPGATSRSACSRRPRASAIPTASALRRPRPPRGPRRHPRLGARAFPDRRPRPRQFRRRRRSTSTPTRAAASIPTGTPPSTISAAARSRIS